jgi:DNA-binding transcriptional ArsR family regulator
MKNLDASFAALAHPVRRKVLATLVRGALPVKDLARSGQISGPALTKHLHILENAGLITRSREGQLRPCRLRARPLQEIDAWMDMYRTFWSESFDKLDHHLKQVQAQRKGNQ